jgi:hypothetical protein
MRRLGSISLLGLAVAAATAGLSAHATSAAALSTSTVDVTYSCPVQKAKVVSIYAGVALPALDSAGALSFDTGIDRKTVNGTTTTKAQASVSPQKNGVKVDKKKCTKLKKPIPLSAKKLPYALSLTPGSRGYTNESCTAAAKVVFRLQVRLTGGKPTSAVLAVRNADAKNKPIALVNWSPQKVSAHLENACTP